MLNFLLLVSAAAAPFAFALPTIEIKASESPLKITRIKADGPTCNSANTSPAITQTNGGIGATGQIGFDTEVAFGKPERSNLAYSDCTLTVDFIFPIGFNINWVDAIAKGEVQFDDGMRYHHRMDIWFPSNNALTATNETRRQGGQGITQNFDLQTCYYIPKSQDFWDACFGSSTVKIRIQQDASSTSRGTGRNMAYTKMEGISINLDEGRNGGKYTSFCSDGQGGTVWSGADAQAENMPKQSGELFGGLLSSGSLLGSGGIFSSLGNLGSTFKTGP